MSNESRPASRPGVARILIVIPTLGQRVDFLRQTLASVAGQSVPADLCLVTPRDAEAARALATGVGAKVLDDPGGQSAAINLGLGQAEPRHEFVNWLGDDDLLTPGSLAAVAAALDAHPDASAAFGHCRYVDPDDRPVWTSRAGRAAPWILPWGPNLIPQPGMLVRRSAWSAVGGLDESLRYSMDLDLLLRLRRVGRLVAVPEVVAAFRWHPDSITVSARDASLAEAEQVKRRYLPRGLHPAAPAWEAPVRWATKRAAAGVSRRAG